MAKVSNWTVRDLMREVMRNPTLNLKEDKRSRQNDEHISDTNQAFVLHWLDGSHSLSGVYRAVFKGL